MVIHLRNYRVELALYKKQLIKKNTLSNYMAEALNFHLRLVLS